VQARAKIKVKEQPPTKKANGAKWAISENIKPKELRERRPTQWYPSMPRLGASKGKIAITSGTASSSIVARTA
jgi:hypothetical protein